MTRYTNDIRKTKLNTQQGTQQDWGLNDQVLGLGLYIVKWWIQHQKLSQIISSYKQ